MSEHNIQKEIVKDLRKTGCIVINTDVMIALRFVSQRMRIPFIQYCKGQGYHKGTSDLIIIRNGECLFAEVKKWSIGKKGQAIGKGKQSPEQENFQEMVEGMGFKYFLIDSPEARSCLFSYLLD